jgi:hypothetical protein
MENVWEIIVRPDNVPIVGLILLLFFFTWIVFKQAFGNDKLLKLKKREK